MCVLIYTIHLLSHGSYRFFTSKCKDLSQTFQRPKRYFQRPVLLISSSKINLTGMTFFSQNKLQQMLSDYHSVSQNSFATHSINNTTLVWLLTHPLDQVAQTFRIFVRCQKVNRQEKCSFFTNFQRPYEPCIL